MALWFKLLQATDFCFTGETAFQCWYGISIPLQICLQCCLWLVNSTEIFLPCHWITRTRKASVSWYQSLLILDCETLPVFMELSNASFSNKVLSISGCGLIFSWHWLSKEWVRFISKCHLYSIVYGMLFLLKLTSQKLPHLAQNCSNRRFFAWGKKEFYLLCDRFGNEKNF